MRKKIVSDGVGNITRLVFANLERHTAFSYTRSSKEGLSQAIENVAMKTLFSSTAVNWRVTRVCAARMALPSPLESD